MSDPGTRVPVGEAIQLVAQELRRMAIDAAEIDHAIGAVLPRIAGPVPSELHRADTVRQSLQGLEKFLLALVDTVDAQGHCVPSVAASQLPLRAQAKRLGEKGAAADEKQDSAQETDLWVG